MLSACCPKAVRPSPTETVIYPIPALAEPRAALEPVPFPLLPAEPVTNEDILSYALALQAALKQANDRIRAVTLAVDDLGGSDGKPSEQGGQAGRGSTSGL